jgi:Fe-S-cluster-containing dehydrogenase component
MQCFTCEVACKAEHDLRPRAEEQPGAKGPRYREVIQVETLETKGETSVQYISMACMHCGSAPCLEVCPTKAIFRDSDYGVVLVNRDLCIGCRYCSWACPFGAPQFDRDGLMQKCDFCIDRLREGKEPACVEYCCGGAIKAGPVEELSTEARGKAAGRLTSAAMPQLVIALK